MRTIVKYRLEYYDGPLNGGERYFDSFASAKRAGCRYIKACSDYPDRVGFDIYCVYSDFTSFRLLTV